MQRSSAQRGSVALARTRGALGRPQNWLQRMLSFDFSNSRSGAPNILFSQLGRGLQQYQAAYGRLPQVKIPAGPTLKRSSTGKRVSLLRQRLGLAPGGGYDEQLFQTVATYQTVHGIGPADGIAGKATIASLNRGYAHYARRIAINVERAYRLPDLPSAAELVELAEPWRPHRTAACLLLWESMANSPRA